MFDAGAAGAKLQFDISELTRGMLHANALMEMFPHTVTTFLANPLLGLVEVAREAGHALFEMFNESAQHANNIRGLAAAVGVTAEQLSGLSLAAPRAGLEGVADAFKFLGRNMADAMSNAGALKNFTDIGVAVADTQGKLRPLNDVMMDVADAMARLPAGGQRTKIAFDLLGRGGIDMVAALSKGSAAIEQQIKQFGAYGAVVSTEAAESAGKWVAAMREMGVAFTGFKEMIAEPMRDALLPYLQELLGWVRTHPAEFRATAKGVADVVVTAFEGIVAAGQLLLPLLKLIVNNLGAVGFVAAALLAIKVIAELVTALRTLAIAKAIALAFSGPTGWAALAVSAGVAAAAVTGIAVAFSDARREMADFQRDMNTQLTPGGTGGAGGGGAVSPPRQAAGSTPGVGGVVIEQLNVQADPNATADAVARQIAPPIRAEMQRQRQAVMNQNISASILLGL